MPEAGVGRAVNAPVPDAIGAWGKCALCETTLKLHKMNSQKPLQEMVHMEGNPKGNGHGYIDQLKKVIITIMILFPIK